MVDESQPGQYAFQHEREISELLARISEAKKLLREALREMTTTTAPRNSFTDCVDKIDAFLTASDAGAEPSP